MADFNLQILGVYGPHFGSRNDKEIVKSNPTLSEVTLGWLSQVFWKYYSASGYVCLINFDVVSTSDGGIGGSMVVEVAATARWKLHGEGSGSVAAGRLWPAVRKQGSGGGSSG